MLKGAPTRPRREALGGGCPLRREFGANPGPPAHPESPDRRETRRSSLGSRIGSDRIGSDGGYPLLPRHRQASPDSKAAPEVSANSLPSALRPRVGQRQQSIRRDE